MKIIKKTRRYFLKLMMSIISIFVIISLLAIYILSYINTETNNEMRLHNFEEIRFTTMKDTLDVNDVLSETKLTEQVASDIGPYISILINKNKEIIYKFSSIQGLSENTYDALKELVLQERPDGKIELNERIWQYKIVAAKIEIHDVSVQDIESFNDASYIRLIDITESQKSLQMLAVTLIVIGVLLLFLFFFFCLYFSKRATKPMVDVLEQQQQFIADASHELKTPISIIKANCGVLQASNEETVASQKQWIENIENGVDRMTQLITNLITVVKIEDSDIKIQRSKICLKEILEEILQAMSVFIQDKQLTVHIEIIGETTIYNNTNLIHQVITIVLDNAIKYSNVHGQIHIIIKQEKKKVSLAIRNTGEGISKEDIRKVFHRFYRGESARTQDGSYGLGLSIADTIMERINGTITVDSVEGKYTIFTLQFDMDFKNKQT